MAHTPYPKSHRFVVVYRAEAREIANAEEVRRGWVERVPDPRAVDAGDTTQDRQGFAKLEELPGLITEMIGRAEKSDTTARRGRRPSP